MGTRVTANEMACHVVGRAKRRPKFECCRLCELRDLFERGERIPQHHSVALIVDAPSPGPSGELGVVASGEHLVMLAGELRQLLDHHGASRHVDTKREGLGGENGFQVSGRKEFLNGLFEQRHDAGVVCGQASL